MNINCDLCTSKKRHEEAEFTPIHDYLAVYPERQLIHVHFGVSTDSETQNTEEAAFIQDSFLRWSQKYPNMQFFVILDFTNSDNSEFVSAEAMKDYIQVLSHPQLAGVAAFGATNAMSAIVRLLIEDLEKPAHLVKSMGDAEKIYYEWYEQNKNKASI